MTDGNYLVHRYTDDLTLRGTIMQFQNIVSLGYNCEVSFRIEDFIHDKIKSYPFSWAYIKDQKKFLDALQNLDDILKHEIEVLPWGMFLDKKYGISFHGKGDKAALFQEDGTVNQAVADSMIEELKSRENYLIEKLKKLLESDQTTLFIVKVPSKKDGKENAEFIQGVLKFLKEHYVSQKFMLLAVAEKSHLEFIKFLGEDVCDKFLTVRSVEAFAEDENTQTGGDIAGWMDVIGRCGEYYPSPEEQEKRDERLRNQIQELEKQRDELLTAKNWLDEQYHFKDTRIEELEKWVAELESGKKWLEEHGQEQEKYIAQLRHIISGLMKA